MKILVFLGCLIPALRLIWLASISGLGANPVEKLIHVTGDWALNFLIITLLISPLVDITGSGRLLKLRKMMGLFCLFYALIHFAAYVVLDQGLSWDEIADDVARHKRIAVGFAGLIFLIPPAVTSVGRIKKKLGYSRWKNFQRATYGAALCAVFHYLWLVKRDLRRPYVYAALLGILFLYRLAVYLLGRKKRLRLRDVSSRE